jgi:predicted permease
VSVPRHDRLERLVRRAYRALLRAYPPAFRAEYGEDVEETFVDRWRDARRRGAGATLRLLVAAAADAVASGARERIETRPPTSRPEIASMLHWQDVRYAFRLLRRSPVFTLLTVVVLGGGLGLSIFTFSFLHTAMLRPLPLDEGERIVRVEPLTFGRGGAIDAADVARARPAITALSRVGAYEGRSLILGSDGGARRHVIDATAAEWTIFELTRTPPALGRGFRPEDGARGAEPVVVLGHTTWRTAFGADSSVVNRVVTLNGVPTRVVGVMPEGYGFPVAADAWVPLDADALAPAAAGARLLYVYGRLAPGASTDDARRELELLLARARSARPPTVEERAAPQLPVRVAVQSFPMAQVGDQGPLILTVLNLLATLILLLACINVVNLLLARANERARETALRLALGAPRPRLVMQSLWESVLLVLAGGALATAGAAWGLSAINGWAQSHLAGNLAFWWVWGLDRATLVAAGGFVTLTIAVLGGVVAARATDLRLAAVLQDASARAGGRGAGRVARALVVTQVATVSVLMFFGVMSGVVARRVATVDLGYDTRNLLSANVGLPAERYPTREKRAALYDALRGGLAQWPAVDGAVLRAPLADIGEPAGELELGDARAAAGARPRAHVQAVAGALGTLGVTVRQGRALDARDRAGAVPVAVVSQAFARRHWPRGSAVGQRVRLAGVGERGAAEWRTVVGVVSDVLLGNPLSRDRSAVAVYVPLAQTDARGAAVLFRHRGDAAAAQAALQQAVAAADPLLPPPDVQTLDEILAKTSLMARSVARLFAGCFGFALLLAVSGTYGLMARAIGRRTREIGVRRALGATDGVIVRALLGQGGRQLGVGALVALPVMLLVGAGFSHFFPLGFGVAAAAGAAVVATIVGVVLAATYVPTRRVLGVAPRDALWRE